jgi:molybdopterin converting factor small subunit
MLVTVKLFATLRNGRFREKRLDIKQGTTTGEIIESLGIREEEVGVTMINSRHCSLEEAPGMNDVVAIFPMIGGG